MEIIEKFAGLYLKQGVNKSEYNIAPNYDKGKFVEDTSYRIYLDIDDYKNNNGKRENYGDPIIMYSINKPEYMLPSGFKDFYQNFSGSEFINNQVLFNSNLEIFPNIDDLPYSMPYAPFTSTCDEWLLIITDKYPENCNHGTNYVFLNCVPKSEHYGRLIFHRTNMHIPGSYLSSWHFEEFLMILTEEYSKFEQLEIKELWESCKNKQYHMHLPSIVNFFLDAFNTNKYFSDRNLKIKPIISTILFPDISDIILSYLYYVDINYFENTDDD